MGTVYSPEREYLINECPALPTMRTIYDLFTNTLNGRASYSRLEGTKISRLPFEFIALITPAASMASISRAALL